MAVAYYTIDHNKIDEDQSNFAVGIKISAVTGFMSGLGTDDWRYLHATVNDVECYVEVVTWDIANEKAVLWVKVSTVLASINTVIKIEITETRNDIGYSDPVEITSPTIYDDFSGTDGDDPNPDLWEKEVLSGEDYLFISDNQLAFWCLNTDYLCQVRLTGKFILSGDFDVQLFFDVFQYSSPSSSVHLFPRMFVSQASDDATIGHIAPYYKDARYSAGGIDEEGTSCKRGVDDSHIRMVRTSGVLKCYYYDSVGRWEWNGDINGLTLAYSNNEDVIIKLLWQDPYTKLQVYADDFQINSCDGISYIGAGYVGLTGDVEAQSVYDESFVAVYNMAQDPSGGTDCILDSTSHENHGTPTGSMTSEDLVAGGFGKALNLDGNDDAVIIPHHTDFNSENLTIELFLSLDTISDSDTFISKRNETNQARFILRAGYDSEPWNGNERFWFGYDNRDDSGEAGNFESGSDLLETGVYSYFVVCHNFGDEASTKIYKNGTYVSGSWISGIGDESPSSIADISIGRLRASTNGSNFDGKIGLVRVSKSIRSPAWIRAMFHVLNDSLLTYSATDPGSSTTYDLIATPNLVTVIPDSSLRFLWNLSSPIQIGTVTPNSNLSIPYDLGGSIQIQTITPDARLLFPINLESNVSINTRTLDAQLKFLWDLLANIQPVTYTPSAEMNIIRNIVANPAPRTLTPEVFLMVERNLQASPVIQTSTDNSLFLLTILGDVIDSKIQCVTKEYAIVSVTPELKIVSVTPKRVVQSNI